MVIDSVVRTRPLFSESLRISIVFVGEGAKSDRKYLCRAIVSRARIDRFMFNANEFFPSAFR